jgi:hypothetical protein
MGLLPENPFAKVSGAPLVPRQASAYAPNLAQLQAQRLTTCENPEEAGLVESSAESGGVLPRRLNGKIRQPRSIRGLQLIVEHDAVQMVVHTKSRVCRSVRGVWTSCSATYPTGAGANGRFAGYYVTTVPTLRPPPATRHKDPPDRDRDGIPADRLPALLSTSVTRDASLQKRGHAEFPSLSTAARKGAPFCQGHAGTPHRPSPHLRSGG